MLDPNHPIAQIAQQDGRYTIDAYMFVFDALNFAHAVLGMGADEASDPDEIEEEDDSPERERHLTGQQLCEAIRLHALNQYGYMAKCVLNSWGVRETGDFGEIVFNMIEAGHMRKTPDDKREDFNDVFDFEKGLVEQFEIKVQE